MGVKVTLLPPRRLNVVVGTNRIGVVVRRYVGPPPTILALRNEKDITALEARLAALTARVAALETA